MRKNKHKKSQPILSVLVSFQFFFSTFIYAYNDSIFDIPLAELLKVKVTAPSKSLLSQNESPGIVTTLTAQEIAIFGGRDLGEVLSRITGFEEFPTLANGRNITTIRGDKPSANNNHVLILLNGIPLNRDSYTGGIWNEAIIASVPLNTVQQLEVIRGPGSVLYGTNAYAGVVNIVTKSAKQMENQFSFTKGKFNTDKATLSLAGEWKDWQWTSALRWYETKGWPFQTKDVQGGTFRGNVQSRSPGFLATFSNGGFSGNAFWGQMDQFTIRGSSNFQEDGTNDNKKYFFDFSYESELFQDWQLKTNFSHVGGRTKHFVSGQLPDQMSEVNYKTNDSRLEFTLSSVLSENSRLLLGSTIDHFKGETPPPRVIVPDWDYYLYGLYGQYEITVSNTDYIFGAQYNKADKGYQKIVPRLGMIHHFDQHSGIKLLYGQAFRAPYVVERKIDVQIANQSLTGDENLAPELVTTWDLQYFYHNKGLSFAATLYRNEQKDLIVRAVTAPNTLNFVNKGELVIEGFELETKYTIENWYFTASFTTQRNEDGLGIEDSTLQPNRVAKIGLNYHKNDWSFSVFDTYTSKYHDNKKVKPFRQNINEPVHSLHRLSANIIYQPTAFAGWEIAMYFDNLLDKTLHLPLIPAEPPQLNTRPALSGRFAMLSISKKF